VSLVVPLAVFLAAVGSAASAMAAGTSWSSGKDRIAIVIDALYDDPVNVPDTETFEGVLIQRMERNYPGVTVYVVRPESADDLTVKLSQLVAPQTEVAALWIASHGETSRDARGAYHSLIGETQMRWLVDLTSPSDVAASFAPLRDHWSDDATVLLLGCSTIDVEEESEVRPVMLAVARHFGLHSGRVYMNYGLGSVLLLTHASTPFYAPPTWLGRLRTLGTQATSFVSYPVFFLRDHFWMNRGYLLELVRGISGQIAHVTKTRLSKVWR